MNAVPFAVLRVAGAITAVDDLVAEEVPVALEYNGISQAVMLATPADLEDFALGFSLSEGIVAGRGEVFDIEVEEGEGGITVHIEIAAAAFARLKERRRNLAGRTGCGLCGVESLAQVKRALAAVPPVPRGSPSRTSTFPFAALCAGMARLPARQTLQQATGATHAAAWLGSHRELAGTHKLACVREDVGRHNALDKVLGALARSGFDPVGGAILVTSRASFEMVQKAAALGIGVLAAVSAPTAAAVRLAEECGLALVGFLRGGSAVVYSHPERLADLSAAAGPARLESAA